jgi:hypothetical protein
VSNDQATNSNGSTATMAMRAAINAIDTAFPMQTPSKPALTSTFAANRFTQQDYN